MLSQYLELVDNRILKFQKIKIKIKKRYLFLTKI